MPAPVCEEETPLMAKENVVPEFLDPSYWHPECSNFEVIDWAKWDAKNPRPPKIYAPPQLNEGKFSGFIRSINFWGRRSPLLRPCGITACLHRCFSPRTTASRISNDEIFYELLDPSRESPTAPDFLRGVWWLKENLAPETLITIHNWAWKSSAKSLGPGKPAPKKPTGPVGLGAVLYNWTSDPTLSGCCFASFVGGLVNIQIHPEGKWIALAFFRDPSKDSRVFWDWIYVVQEGDEFYSPDGEKLDYLTPGNLIRLTWSQQDVYECDNANLNYMYTPLKVATLDKDGKTLVRHHPAYDDLQKRATQRAKKRPCCFGRLACNLSSLERLEFALEELSDKQMWTPSPPPPTAAIIDRF